MSLPSRLQQLVRRDRQLANALAGSVEDGIHDRRRDAEEGVPDVQVALALVAAGLGVNPVAAALQRFRRRGVVYRPLRPRSLRIELGLAWRRDDDSALVQQFRRVARETARRAERRR
jgi:DNA-binding transcriptional LysR family regulator